MYKEIVDISKASEDLKNDGSVLIVVKIEIKSLKIEYQICNYDTLICLDEDFVFVTIREPMTPNKIRIKINEALKLRNALSFQEFYDITKNTIDNDDLEVWVKMNENIFFTHVINVLNRKQRYPFEASEILSKDMNNDGWVDLYNQYIVFLLTSQEDYL